MATSPIRQLKTGQLMQGGILLFREHGQELWDKIGPCGATALDIQPEETIATSDESGKAVEIGSWVHGGTATLTIADIQMRTKTLEEALFLAKTIYATQAAGTETRVIEGVKVGSVFSIPGIRPTISITDGETSAVDYDEDVDGDGDGHYIYQVGRGIGEITKLPVGAGPDIEISVTRPVITEADKIVKRQIFKTAGKRGELRILGAVGESMPGVPQDYWFPDVQMRGDGARTVKGVDGLMMGALTCKVYDTDGRGFGESTDYIEV